MLFFPNATLYVSELTTVKNDEGAEIKTFDYDNPIEVFKADVQPNVQYNFLTEVNLKPYGFNQKMAYTKKCYTHAHDGNSMKVGNRVKVVYDNGNPDEYYNIEPINFWRRHKEFLLLPVENEESEDEDDENEDTGNEGIEDGNDIGNEEDGE